MFDFRYHALSLVAVFLALGIGILLGVTIGDSLLSEADQGLRESLRQDVVEARAASEQASTGVERRDQLIDDVLPALAGGRLSGERVAVIGLGSLPEDTVASVREAVEAGNGRIDSVTSLPLPPVTGDLARAVGGRFASADQSAVLSGPLGRRVAVAIARGDRLARKLAAELPDQFSGDYEGATAVVYHRTPEGEATPETDAFETALLDGLDDAGVLAVGVEEFGADPSQISFYSGRGLSSVDSVDVPGGRLALVYALAGAKGSFGFKETADEPLPEVPAAGAQEGPAVRGRR